MSCCGGNGLRNDYFRNDCCYGYGYVYGYGAGYGSYHDGWRRNCYPPNYYGRVGPYYNGYGPCGTPPYAFGATYGPGYGLGYGPRIF